MMTLNEIHEELESCIELLKSAGRAYKEGNQDELFVNMGSMAPRLERATENLRLHVENRKSKEALDVPAMDDQLASVGMTWGYTRTPPEAPLVADDICIVRRAVCADEFLQQVERARGEGRDSTESGTEKMWEKTIKEPRVLLSWDGIRDTNGEKKAVFDTGTDESVIVDAHRLAAIRALTLFDRAEYSMHHEPALVLLRSDDPTPVAILLVEDNE